MCASFNGNYTGLASGIFLTRNLRGTCGFFSGDDLPTTTTTSTTTTPEPTGACCFGGGNGFAGTCLGIMGEEECVTFNGGFYTKILLVMTVPVVQQQLLPLQCQQAHSSQTSTTYILPTSSNDNNSTNTTQSNNNNNTNTTQSNNNNNGVTTPYPTSGPTTSGPTTTNAPFSDYGS